MLQGGFCVLILVVCLVKPAFAEGPLAFAKRYINDVNVASTPEEYKQYWITPIQKKLDKDADKLKKDFAQAVKMHELFLADGSISSAPHVFEPMAKIISYTFKLNTPIANTVIYPETKQPPHNLIEYQLTVQNEDGVWKVTGETFVGLL